MDLEADRGTGFFRPRAARLLQHLIEAVVLIMVCFAPWAYGAVHSGFEFVLDVGVAVLTVLWGLRILCQGQFTWQKCPVSLALTGLFLLGLWQTVPLPASLLTTLSPATAAWYAELLPAVPEQLPFEESRSVEPAPAGSTISVYPFATRRFLQRLLAVLLLFLVVRNNLRSASSFRRLAIAVFVNGALLAFFGIIQFFSSPRNLLYWTVPSMGMQVFGPFIYRNHFACYINLCFGMGLGLLWSRSRHRAARSPAAPFDSGLGYVRRTVAELSSRLLSALGLLRDPASMWICAGLALMMTSVILTLSRGGFMALIGGFVVCFIIQLAGAGRFLRQGAACWPAWESPSGFWGGLARPESKPAMARFGAAKPWTKAACLSGPPPGMS